MKYKILFCFPLVLLMLGCVVKSGFTAPPPSMGIEACELSLPSDGGSIGMCFKAGNNRIFVQWNGELSSNNKCTFDVTEENKEGDYKAYSINPDSTEEEAVLSMLDQWLYKSPRAISDEFSSEELELREAYVISINRVKGLVQDRPVSPYCK